MFSCCWIKLESIQFKFKLPDGTQLGPFSYSLEDTVAQLKSSVVSNWPEDKGNRPKKGENVNFTIGERILADNMEISELSCADSSAEILTIRVVVQQNSDKSKDCSPKKNRCLCIIL